MPTYDYECRKCHHAWEKFESISARPGTVCPKCRRKTAKRLIGAGGGLLFKGSGFYITDNRTGEYKSKASAENPSPCTKADKSTGTCPAAAGATECPCAPAKTASGKSAKNKKAS